MQKFNQAIAPHLRKELDVDMSEPVTFFRTIFEELIEKYNIFEDFNKLKEIKQELLARIHTSKLSKNQKDKLTEDVTEIDDYARLFMFMDQEMGGF